MLQPLHLAADDAAAPWWPVWEVRVARVGCRGFDAADGHRCLRLRGGAPRCSAELSAAAQRSAARAALARRAPSQLQVPDADTCARVGRLYQRTASTGARVQACFGVILICMPVAECHANSYEAHGSRAPGSSDSSNASVVITGVASGSARTELGDGTRRPHGAAHPPASSPFEPGGPFNSIRGAPAFVQLLS